MARTSRSLIPPPRRPNDGPPLPPELYIEPAEEILLVGEMLHDAQTMKELLAGLPFERDGYRASLRIIAGASTRMRQRCERLLGERTIRSEPESFTLHSIAHSSVVPTEPIPADVQPGQAIEADYLQVDDAPTAAAILAELKEHGEMKTTDLIEAVAKKGRFTTDHVADVLADLRTKKKVLTGHKARRGLLNWVAE